MAATCSALRLNSLRMALLKLKFILSQTQINPSVPRWCTTDISLYQPAGLMLYF